MTSVPLLYPFRSGNQPTAGKGSYLPGFSCFDKADFAPLGEDSGIPQRLHNIIAFKVGIIREQFIYAHTRANLPDDHADSYPHTANTWLAPHNGGVLSYPVKVFFVHKASILRKQAKNKGVGAGTPDTVACIDIAKQTKPKRSMNMKKTIVIALVLILLASCAKKETPNKDDFVMDGTVLVNYRGNAANVVIPEGVTVIGGTAFYFCKNITNVTIPSSVTSIGNGAFFSCSSLTSIIIPTSVNYIGFSAFGRCSSLTSVTIPSSVTSIGDGAFEQCTSLTSVTILSSVITIGDIVLFGCDNLETVTVSRKAEIREDAFPAGVQIIYSD